MHALLDRLRPRRGEHRAVFAAFAAALGRLMAPDRGEAAGGTAPRPYGEARVRNFGEAG